MDGGRIILAEPITGEEIIAGALDFIIRGGTIETNEHLQIADRSSAYETSFNGDALWAIEAITSPSTELIVHGSLTEREYNLVSIERKHIYFSPNLPWIAEGENKIGIKDGITMADIEQSKIKVITSEGEAVMTPGSSLRFGLNNKTVLDISRFSGTLNIITANRPVSDAPAVTQILVN